MNKIFLSVVTPAYNRAKLLLRLFHSLEAQTCQDFVWIIIDDGSTDDTKEEIQNLSTSSPFEIKYIYKQNGGKHTALNVAFNILDSEMSIIVDSDDSLTVDAVENVKKDWMKYKNQRSEESSQRPLCGISYLKGYSKDNMIGERYTRDYLISNFIDERYNRGVKGDKAEVVVTQCLKDFRFPEYEGERFISESVLWIWLAERYDMLFVNKIIYIAEYQQGGLSATGRKLRFQCPHLMAYGSLITMTKHFSLKIRIKETLLYIVYSLFGHFGWKKIFSCKYKGLVGICAVPGWVLYRLWKRKYKM